MTIKNNRPGVAAELRKRAEEIVREEAASARENLATLPPEEMGRMLHELRVHQIELTMQNEELRRSQAELDAGRARYFDLYDLAPVGYVTVSEKGLILETNLTAATLLGVTRGALVHQQLSRFILTEDQDLYYLHHRQLLETGEPQVCELRMVKQDGTAFWARLEATVAQGEGGAPVSWIVMSDTTRRKQAEAERERLLLAIKQAGDMIVITDPAGAIEYINPAFETVTGYNREEVIGKNPRILNSGKQDDAFYRNLWETISSGKTFRGRLVNKRKDGSFFTEEATISPVRDASGQTINYVAVKHDITEHLQLTAQFQQAQKMESVGRLAGGVAHDYNNMLSVILGFSALAIDKVDPADPLHGDLQEIINAAKRATEITRQLLAFARKQTVVPQELDLNTTIESMLKMLRRLIGEDIALSWTPKANLWPVKIDPSQLDQILANLCVNARDAITDVGKIIIETQKATFDEAYCKEHPGFVRGDFVMLAVSDDGCGIEKEDMENIFEPFFTTKELGRGTGLGLATVYGIVKQNNGFINVYSEPGKGTTFKIYLPRHEGNPSRAVEEREVTLLRGKGETVLVVEDDKPILNLVDRILQGFGYTVRTANSANEALDLAKRHADQLHLLVTDVVMPKMNGRELANQIQALCPNLKTLFMSGHTADAIGRRGVLDEGVNFIQKPFSSQALATAVRIVLDA